MYILFKAYYELYLNLSSSKKMMLFYLLGLMLLSGLAEIFSLALLFPFMTLIISPDKIMEIDFLSELIFYMDMGDDLILMITIPFIISIVLSGIIKLTLLKVNSLFVFSYSAELSAKIYKNVLSYPYQQHTKVNSSEIINGITQKVHTTIYGAILPLLTAITSLVVSLFIVALLLFIDHMIVIYVLTIFSIFYFIVVGTLRNRLKNLSGIIPRKSTEALKNVQEGLGYIRDIIIDNVGSVFVKKFLSADTEHKTAQGLSMFYNGVPKIILETLLLFTIVVVLFNYSNKPESLITLLPLFSVFILSLQKLLPLFQALYSSYSNIIIAKHSVEDVLSLLKYRSENKVKINKMAELDFNKKINLTDICFAYDSENIILTKLNLSIEKGETIGIVGESGSGKTTLVDILMGLLVSNSGEILVDDQILTTKYITSWQHRIAHVPQFVYLSDATIYENIAFGIESGKIDRQKVMSIVQDVKLKDVFNRLPEGLNTKIGENGSRLSGGQRQRVGIARALYKNVDVLFLDEATSALDNDTEETLMKVIGSLKNITIIMIAHRISSLSICDRIIELKSGAVSKEYSYNDFIKK